MRGRLFCLSSTTSMIQSACSLASSLSIGVPLARVWARESPPDPCRSRWRRLKSRWTRFASPRQQQLEAPGPPVPPKPSDPPHPQPVREAKTICKPIVDFDLKMSRFTLKESGGYHYLTLDDETPEDSLEKSPFDLFRLNDEIYWWEPNLSLYQAICNPRPNPRRIPLADYRFNPDSRCYIAHVDHDDFVVKIGYNPCQAILEAAYHEQIHAEFDKAWPWVNRSISDMLVPKVYVPASRKVASVPYAPQGFIMEYIQPLGTAHRKFLARKYVGVEFAQQMVSMPGWKVMTLRPCMGQMRPHRTTYSRLQNVENVPVYLDDLLAECFYLTKTRAASMGAALALLHWKMGLDATGVEFHIGMGEGGKTAIWMNNFEHCKTFTVTDKGIMEHLVRVVMLNPCWPRQRDQYFKDSMLHRRPGCHIWHAFCGAYETIGLELTRGTSHNGRPSEFMRNLCLEWTKRNSWVGKDAAKEHPGDLEDMIKLRTDATPA